MVRNSLYFSSRGMIMDPRISGLECLRKVSGVKVLQVRATHVTRSASRMRSRDG